MLQVVKQMVNIDWLQVQQLYHKSTLTINVDL